MAAFARVESLLATSLRDVTDESLARFVEGAVREDSDLDFKEALYGNSDSARRDLSGDIAALANTIGGVVVLGVRDEEAVAVELTPVALSDAEEVRMQQVAASHIAPHASFTIHRVPTEANLSLGYYLIEVPRSPQSPHAVRVGAGLRYPRRSGASIRWLTESEVADAYRDRFFAAREQVARLASVRQEGQAALPELRNSAWLSMALVPNQTGTMQLTQQRVRELRDFPGQAIPVRLHGSRLAESAYEAGVGYRRAVLAAGGRDVDGAPRDGLVHLHDDGSGYVSVLVGRAHRRDGTEDEETDIPVDDELLTQEVVSGLALLANHAVLNSGAGGDAAVEATVVAHPARSMYLGHNRGFGEAWGPSVSSAAVGRHTIALDDVTQTPVGNIISARMVLTDLLQGFGIAESPQLTPDGAVRRRYFRDGQRLGPMIEKQGLDVTDETLG